MTHSTVKREKISKIPLPSEPPPTPLPLIGPGKSWSLNPRRFLIPSQTCFSDTSLPASWRCSQELTLLWCSSNSFHSSEQLFLCPSCYTQAAPVGLQPLENLQVVLLPGKGHDPTPVRTHQAGCLSAEKGRTGPRSEVPGQGPQVVLQGKHCTPLPSCCSEAEAQAPIRSSLLRTPGALVYIGYINRYLLY